MYVSTLNSMSNEHYLLQDSFLLLLEDPLKNLDVLEQQELSPLISTDD